MVDKMTNDKRRHKVKLTLVAFAVLIALDTMVQRRINISPKFRNYSVTKNFPIDHVEVSDNRDSSRREIFHDTIKQYTISEAVKNEYRKWHKKVRSLSQMDLSPKGWTPDRVVRDWSHHARERKDRFPGVHERIEYYMGNWYNLSISLYGEQFEKNTFIQRKTTREYGPFSDILINLYNLDKDKLGDCYSKKKELHVMSPYCRDYIDLAILHSEGSANIIHNIGDNLPSYIPNDIMQYPIFAKVRPLCDDYERKDFENKRCQRDEKIETIILPLNRKRHFGVAAIVPEIDIPFEEKLPKAVWRGMYGKTHERIVDTNDIKYALVSKYLNSTVVDAKYSKHVEKGLDLGMDPNMVGSYMEIEEQLSYKYVISIEGNDVSSGLKWMLFSNSIAMTPSFTWESWAMEGRLLPFVHYIPLKADMSNVEEMIEWAESHPDEARLIAERSTIYIYDLLFHPDGIKDERKIIEGIMERFEQNFGSHSEMKSTHPSKGNSYLGSYPADRNKRFPSVEERVKFCMGNWYYNENNVSMNRANIHQLTPSEVLREITDDGVFIADGHELSICAMQNSSYTDQIRRQCNQSIPEFDERNTADLKSNSFKRLVKSKRGKSIIIADTSSWVGEDRGKKEAKRVILDDSVKILYFGRRPLPKGHVDYPYFAKLRKSGVDKDSTEILWPFDFDESVEIAKSGLVERYDQNFSTKQAKAIWRGGLGTNTVNPLESSEFVNRYNLVQRAQGLKQSVINAKFVFSYDERGIFDGFSTNVSQSSVDEGGLTQKRVKDMLSYRYLIATENEETINIDLMWMLLSNSVVLLPSKRRVESWLMESFLKPYVHFVPIASNYSDIERQIQWCEEHLEEAKKISDRATVFVHDFLFHFQSEKDNAEVRFRVMERYAELFG